MGHKSNLTNQQISEFLASRRSTRDFLDKPIPQEVLDQILTDALTAPSWSNTRPFMIAIADGEIKDRISDEFSKRWAYLSKNLRAGIVGKLRIAITRYGLPTSNRLISNLIRKI
ncbi:MAG: nitroreductase family protein [Candidatus Nanopelagicaceae bacterium]